MNILYTINQKYIDIMLTSLYSLIKNSKLDKIKLYIVTLDFAKEDYDKIKRFIDNFSNVEIYTYSLEDNPIDKYNIPSWRGSQIANARLFYPRIIKEEHNIDNLLYIDSDTLVINSLKELNEYNDYTINACKEGMSLKSYYHSLDLNKYYNTGVLYFNLNKWLDLDLEDRIKYLFKNNKYNITFPDQDTLNLVLKDEINTIPQRYNLATYPYLFNKRELKLYYNDKYRQSGYNEMLKEKEKATILHSLGLFNIKPWTNNKVNPFTKEFMDYMEKVNPNFQLEELSILKKILTISPELFKMIIIVRTYLPEKLEEKNRNLSMKLQKAR